MFLLRFHSNRFASPNTKGAGLRARDTEVDERETPIGAATEVPSGSGAFAGHALSQRSLTVAALPDVRCTPGFSRLARTSVKRLTFKSRAPGLFGSALIPCAGKRGWCGEGTRRPRTRPCSRGGRRGLRR